MIKQMFAVVVTDSMLASGAAFADEYNKVPAGDSQFKTVCPMP